MIVLAVDPGDTTGWAVADVDRSTFKVIATGTMLSWSYLERIAVTHLPALVIYETFTVFPGKAKALAGDALEAVQTIGALKHICHQRSLTIIGQQPSIKKVPVLPRDGWLTTYLRSLGSEHEKDAVMHIYAYWRKSVMAREQ